MRLFCCELMTFLMDHDHDVFDKNDMLLILFSRVRNGWHKEAAGQPAEALKQIRMINTYLFLWLCITNKCMCCLNKSNWSPISCPMLRGVRIGRNDVCLPDKTRKGRQVVADNMNEWHCTGFENYCLNAFEEKVWEELLVLAIDNLSGFLVQKSTANWLRTLIFLQTKFASWVVKLGGNFAYKAVTDKIGQN